MQKIKLADLSCKSENTLEQLQFLLDNYMRLSHMFQQKTEFNKSQRICLALNHVGINIPIFDTHEKIKEYFIENRPACKTCGGEVLLKNRNLRNNFLKYCSETCEYEGISIRQTGKN